MRTLAELNATHEGNIRAKEFVQMAAILAKSRGKVADSKLYARTIGISARVIAALEQKASAGSTNTGSGEWGSELAALSQGFVSSLSFNGAFDSALPAMVRMPARTRISLVIGRAIGGEVGTGQIKPVSTLELGAPTLAEKRVAVILVCTDEMLRLAGPEGVALLQRAMRDAVAGASDALFVSTLSAALTPIGSTGNILADLQLLAEAITTSGATSRFYVVVSSLNAKRIALARTTDGAPMFPQMTVSGGTIAGIQVQVVSDETISDTEVLAYDAAQVAAAAGDVTLNASQEALVDMGGSLTSLFQRDNSGLLCERTFGFELLRETGAALLNNVDYSNPVSS